MLHYEIVRIPYKYKFWNKRLELEENHIAIMESYVQDGWRFVQMYSSPTKGYGYPEHLELIFEKDLAEPLERRVKYKVE